MAGDQQKSVELIARLERLPFSPWHKRFFLIAFLGIMFDAVDFALFGSALPLIAKEFGFGPAESGMLATVGLIGAFLGALFWGTISDFIGRRTSFRATIAVFAIFTALVAASWNVLSLAVFRLISNFGLGGEVPVTTTLAAEFSPSRIRGRMTGNILAGFPVGLAAAAGLSLLILPNFGWRVLFAVGVIPALLLFATRRYMPESIRYLLSKGRVAEAERTVAEIERTAIGRTPAPEELNIVAVIKPEVSVPTSNTVLELFAPGRRKMTTLVWVLSFCYLWASNGIVFMLPTILLSRDIPLSRAITFLLIQAVAGIIGYSACSFLIDRYGRRPVLFLYYFVGAFFHLWFAMSSGFATFFAIFFVGLVNPGAFGATGVYVSELYPTHMRSTAVGWFFGVGRIGSFLAPVVVGFMIAYSLGEYTLYTFALAYLIGSFALLGIGIETRGRVLEEIAEAKTA